MGVNAAGLESGNDVATETVDLPWLQDTTEVGLWDAWSPVWRDVVILDRNNVPVEVYNLTDHNLSDPDEYDGLARILVRIASE